MTDREIDRNWIRANVQVLAHFARQEFETKGRGMIVVDHRVDGVVNPWTSYVPQASVPADDPDSTRMVKQYDPATKMVITLLKRGPWLSSYRLGMPAVPVTQ